MNEELYKQYLSNEREIKELKRRNDELLGKIYLAHESKLAEKEEGTVNIHDGIYKVAFVKKNTVSVDQDRAKFNPSLFSCKYSFSKTLMDKLSDEQKVIVNNSITIKPAKPSLKIEIGE